MVSLFYRLSGRLNILCKWLFIRRARKRSQRQCYVVPTPTVLMGTPHQPGERGTMVAEAVSTVRASAVHIANEVVRAWRHDG